MKLTIKKLKNKRTTQVQLQTQQTQTEEPTTQAQALTQGQAARASDGKVNSNTKRFKFISFLNLSAFLFTIDQVILSNLQLQ
ncbi:hypothetical protein [uncultured Nostoc sp.]|uniref:hypothetical protein n=1 Tax=uncultured Nostoc sp. TaxID=340711 RepID=UPI0035CAC5E9